MTSLLRKGTHNDNVDTVKLAHWQCKLVERSNSVVVDLGMITGSAGYYPSSDTSIDAMSHKVLHGDLSHGLNSWMGLVEDSVENKTP